ncbi:MAG: isochorismatase family protein [Candidatus Lokiarchaeota archaeon]|nr:isochorismatase family protein [Candidatus Lokiarchaeota archaeon]
MRCCRKMANNDEDKLYIIITMCLQNDFCEKIPQITIEEINSKFGHKVHLNYEETQRLWGLNNEMDKFINDMMRTAAIANSNDDDFKEYHFIHIRDWHDNSDREQLSELKVFGDHCIKGTHGAKFISPMDDLIKENLRFNLIVNSNSLNSFVHTNLDKNLKSIIESCGCDMKNVYIGIIGVVTNIKILFLAYDLSVTYQFPNVFLCTDLTAGFNKDGHDKGLELINNVALAQTQNLNDFRQKFEIL